MTSERYVKSLAENWLNEHKHVWSAYDLLSLIKLLEAEGNCREYALGHADGVSWCRNALNKAIEERGREFAIDFLDEYLMVKP